jgi:DNA polymerase-3 subunit alpha
VHSEFSLLDGLSRIGEMTQRVADQGMTALALTDHGSMYGGSSRFYAAARKAGIRSSASRLTSPFQRLDR